EDPVVLNFKLRFAYRHFYVVGWQGLIAYGCHSLVLIVDTNTAQTLQVLERHKANVVKVRYTCFKVCLLLSFHALHQALHRFLGCRCCFSMVYDQPAD
uniref:Uncharacterized protein n=1 Tax=Apteryx owenii TaxID=8824 RepID=A0A8B9PLK2_APTOW